MKKACIYWQKNFDPDFWLSKVKCLFIASFAIQSLQNYCSFKSSVSTGIYAEQWLFSCHFNCIYRLPNQPWHLPNRHVPDFFSRPFSQRYFYLSFSIFPPPQYISRRMLIEILLHQNRTVLVSNQVSLRALQVKIHYLGHCIICTATVGLQQGLV